MADMEVKRGQVWWVGDSMSVGAEMAIGRPGVVVSADCECAKSPVVTVVYTTTQPQTHTGSPCILYSGQKRWAHCNQPVTVDKSRLKRCETTLSEQEMSKVDKALVFTLGLNRVAIDHERELREKQAEQEKEMIRLQADRDIHKKLYVAVLEKLAAMQLERDLAVKMAEPVVANPVVEESAAEESVASVEEEPVATGGLLNPNTCTFDEMRANGVTPNLCLQIIAHRPYRDMSELACLPGINDWVYDRLCEGMYIPPVEKPKKPEYETPELVDLNTCSEDDLKSIGFRPDVAKMIIAARPYTYVDDLRGVPGVTRIAYQLVEKKVTVSQVEQPKPKPEKPKTVKRVEPVKPVEPEEPVKPVEKPVVNEVIEKVNVNEASGKEIHEKTGINLNTCYGIVGYRKRNGPYRTLKELINVTNFSSRMLERYRDKLVV